MINTLLTVLALVVIFTVLVAAHEFGHYLFARIFGMGIEEFAIGFGRKPILTYMRRTYDVPLVPGQQPELDALESGAEIQIPSVGSALEGAGGMRPASVVDTPSGRVLRESTDFTVRPWPLGGFVRIKGMMPEEDGSEVNIPGGFYSKPPWMRFFALLAGPAFSILAGVLILTGLFMTQGTLRVDNLPLVFEIKKGSGADHAGLKPGDRIVSINDEATPTYYDVVVRVRNAAGVNLKVGYRRGDALNVVNIVPKLGEEPTEVLGPDLKPTGEKKRQAILGFAPGHMVRLGLPAATLEACRYPVKLVELMGGMVRKPSQAGDQVGGPISIVRATKEAVDDGIGTVVYFSAMLSMSVGMFNMLPIFPLDGGQMAVALAEMFRRGRRLSMRVQTMVSTFGFAVVLLLVFTVVILDVSRLKNPSVSGAGPGSSKTQKP